jgi:phosphoribosylformimino-5-aminoimidazole carboxamide ribotide isomerase
VSSLDDIRLLTSLEDDGVIGAVIGRALYEGGLQFKDCVAAVKAG